MLCAGRTREDNVFLRMRFEQVFFRRVILRDSAYSVGLCFFCKSLKIPTLRLTAEEVCTGELGSYHANYLICGIYEWYAGYIRKGNADLHTAI